MEKETRKDKLAEIISKAHHTWLLKPINKELRLDEQFYAEISQTILDAGYDLPTDLSHLNTDDTGFIRSLQALIGGEVAISKKNGTHINRKALSEWVNRNSPSPVKPLTLVWEEIVEGFKNLYLETAFGTYSISKVIRGYELSFKRPHDKWYKEIASKVTESEAKSFAQEHFNTLVLACCEKGNLKREIEIEVLGKLIEIAGLHSGMKNRTFLANHVLKMYHELSGKGEQI